MSRRYDLRSPEVLRWVMDHPGRGVPYSVRSLAAATGCSPALIGGLLTGRQKSAGMEDAHSIAEAGGVAVLVLFAPPATPNQVTPTTDPDQKE
ncbi:MAG TPA: hypothetical protein VFO59_06675 [Dehalococcoidia bacterium]|nr:hypothetical protein [Dehalococcoidia bacterium]